MRSLIEEIKLELSSLDDNSQIIESDDIWTVNKKRTDFPLADIHKIFRGLDRQEIYILETHIERKLPEQLSEFYKAANGLSLFYGSMSIAGLIVEGRQPIDLRYGNVIDRPMENGKLIDNSNQIRFGGYCSDEHVELMMYLDDAAVYAVRGFREGPIYYRWPSLEVFLRS